MSILGINGGTGIPLYPKKMRGCTWRGEHWARVRMEVILEHGIMIPDASSAPCVSRLVSGIISVACNRLRCTGYIILLPLKYLRSALDFESKGSILDTFLGSLALTGLV